MALPLRRLKGPTLHGQHRRDLRYDITYRSNGTGPSWLLAIRVIYDIELNMAYGRFTAPYEFLTLVRQPIKDLGGPDDRVRFVGIEADQ